MTTTRRQILQGAIATAVAAKAGAALAEGLPPAAGDAARDRAFWDAVARQYAVSDAVTNLENGYWGIMAEPVRREYERLTAFVNRDNTAYARSRFGADLEDVRKTVAAELGAKPAEIALTRGATEALQALIGGYNRLQPGDAVLYADLDYDSMQYAMNWLKARRGVDVIRMAIPEPATRANVLETYDAALKANPKLKLLLLTHISHRTGLMMPVAEIAAMARARGVDVIVDAAHSWGQVDFKVTDLGADFAGFNLHKWIGAPVGVGCLYIREARIADIDPYMADEDFPAADVRARIHTGTANFAAMLAVPKALEFHRAIGAPRKEARLRHLRNHWVAQARDLRPVQVLTPDDPTMVAGITSFRLAGKTSRDDNNALAVRLRDEFKVLTVRRAGVAAGQCIRVTPALYTQEADLDRLAAALRAVTSAG